MIFIKCFFVVAFLAVSCVGSVLDNEVDEIEDSSIADDVLEVFGRPLSDPSFHGCVSNSYPEDESLQPKAYTINLDLPPRVRWQHLVHERKDDIRNMLTNLKNFTIGLFHGKLFSVIDKYLPFIGETLPSPFREEIFGIADATGIPLGEIVLYNIFNEMFSVCTSIVAQDKMGKLYHARNLDFGLFLGWDSANKTWLTTEYLRPLIVKLTFVKQGKVLFHSVQFAGYIGILTGLKENAFTLTVNERFQLKGGYWGVVEWIFGRRSSQWMGFLTRKVLEDATSYKQALKMLSSEKLLSPVYFILGGKRPGEGSVITRSQGSADVWKLGRGSLTQNSTWYVSQTNYDHWTHAPFWDDRQTPTVTCMEASGQDTIGFSSLYNVLSSPPILNKLTTYTALMQVDGQFEVYLRTCKGSCWPW